MGADVFEALAEARRAGRPVVMGTTVRIEGNPPSAPGNRALFGGGGELLAGTIGCNGLDRRTGADGRGLLAAGERSGLRRYTSFEGEPGEGVVEVFLEAFAEASAELGPGDAVVFVDHDDPDLVPAVTRVLEGRAGYVGVMGSRRHTPGFVATLRAAGLDLGRLHSPTGLDIGARVPSEIAVSIMAEVLAATRGRAGGSLDIVAQPAGTAGTTGH